MSEITQQIKKNSLRATCSVLLGLQFLVMGTGLLAQPGSGRRSMTGPPVARAPWNRTRMPVGSYLPRPARDIQELRDQINNEPAVMEKYRRVFNGRTDEEIRQYLNTLVLTRTTGDVEAGVWYAHPDGVLGYRDKIVRKGTYVFADPKTGKPILAQVCGNPLRKVLDLPFPLKPAINTSSIQEFLEDEPLPPRKTAVLNVAMFDMAAMRIAPPAISNINVVRLQLPQIGRAFIGFSPVTPPLIPPVIPAGGGFFIPPIIPPIIGGGDTPPPIPEPGLISLSITALGSGIVLRGTTWRRRKRA